MGIICTCSIILCSVFSNPGIDSYPLTVPSAPREIRVDILTQQFVVVSWLPPDPANGNIIDYTVQVFIAPSGELFDSRVVTEEFVNLTGLDLDNVRYRISVSANTSVGSGPDSEPIYIGMGLTLPSSTPTQPPSATPTISIILDDTYYIVRIVPPLVFGLFLILVLVVTVLFFLHLQRITVKKRTGTYKFSELESEGGYGMK